MRRINPWVAGVGLCVVAVQAPAFEVLTTFNFDFEQTGTSAEIAAYHLTSVGVLSPFTFTNFNYLVEGQDRDPGESWIDQDGLAGFNDGVAIGQRAINSSIGLVSNSGFLGIKSVTFRYSTSGVNQFTPTPTSGPLFIGSNNSVLTPKPECSNITDASYCNWDMATISFDSVFQSLGFNSNAGANTFIFSDLSITVASNSPSPIPEPSTYALMALGLAGIAAISRRRRKED